MAMESGQWREPSEKRKLLRSKVRKVNVNSTPEKITKKRKWNFCRDFRSLRRVVTSRLAEVLSLVAFLSDSECSVSDLAFPPALRVSGRATMRKSVSNTRSTKVNVAGTAYMLTLMSNACIARGRGLVAKYAPIGGPIQKQIAKAIPTWARALDLVACEETSERIAL